MRPNNIEDIYPLSPMQQGMLFHTLVAATPGSYVVQIAWTLQGLDPAALRGAFEEVVERHPALRTAFAWEKVEQPVQIVWKRLKLPWEDHDLRALSAGDQAARVRDLAAAERERGFDPSRAPLLRVAALRLSDDTYRVVWTMHHLVLDGWSTQIVVRDIFTLYEARRQGREARLDRPRPYGDLISWLDKRDRAPIEAFWRRRLRGFTSPTPLGVDRGLAGFVSAIQGARFGDVHHRWPEQAGAALAAFARRVGLTLNTLVQGAWALLLSRYGETEDVVFGATVSGRSAPLPGIDRMVGLFINTLPVRARIAPASPADAWLLALQGQEAEAREHEQSSLAEIQGWSAVPRGTPLFDSLVVFENFPFASAAGDRRSSTLAVIGAEAHELPPYPLTLTAVFQRTLELRLAYDARRFERGAVERMLAHLATLLEAIVATPDTPLGQLPMLSAAEIEDLATWNATARPHPVGPLLHELCAAQVTRTPSAIALSFDGESLTHQALDDRSTALAAHLVGLGVGPDVRVAVCLERSLDLPVALLAVLKAGGAYLPVDPTYPRERIAFMLEDARASVLITHERLRSELPAGDARVVTVEVPPTADAGPAARRPGPEDLAYVIYTSGSTGRPKAAMVPHRAIVNHMQWMATRYPLHADDVVLHKTPISFDASVWEIFLPLMMGARLAIAPPGAHRDPAALIAAVVAERATVLQLVPSVAEAMLAEPDLERAVTLDRLFLGGEALRRSLVSRWRARHPARVINLYGPTECAVDTLTHDADPEGGAEVVPVGRPIDNVAAHIVDRSIERVPVGVAGELCLGGRAVGRGYWARPELTAERFIPDPFGDAPGGRLYRTGDRCRRRADGVIEYLGRLDAQVKLRGVRIELGEIESALAAIPGVRRAAVVVREDAPGDARLVAYVEPDGGPPLPATLRSALAARLPEAMVPAAYVIVDAFPRSPSGKLDRAALPAPGAGALVERDPIPPRTPIEQAVAAAYAEILQLPGDAVGAGDGFFALGGHSLLATRVVSRLRAELGVDLPIRALFEAPVVGDLAARIELARGDRTDLTPIPRIPRDAPLALSFGQERLWFLHKLDPASAAYVVPLALRLSGALDIGALERALTEIVRRHEVLRTTFRADDDGKPVQVVHEPRPVELGSTMASLATLPADERERALREAAGAEARRPFDLAEGPVIRARLLAIGPGDHALLLTLHHIVSDAWTSAILNREITALYAAFRAGEPSPLPAVPIQYADYAAWQRGRLSGDLLRAQLDYWRAALDGAPPSIDLPTDRPRPAVPSYRGGQRVLRLSSDLSTSLKDLARRHGATLYMTLLAAFDVLLHRITGQDDVVVGTPIAGRTRAELEGLIGFFLNSLVMRARLSSDLTFKDLLGRVKETALGAYAHQDLPFERLVQELRPDADPSRSPIFQVIFNLQNAPRERARLPGLDVLATVPYGRTVKVDLTLIMADTAEGLVGRFEYASDLFDSSTIDRLVGWWETLLGAVARSPERRIHELPLLPDAERGRLVVEWNDTATPFPHACFHELFEAQVDAAPGAPALVAGQQRLSYGELDVRANRLAHHLRRHGVGPDAVVGLCCERDADAVVAILAILKAGAAYLPLDPSHPPQRLARLLTGAGAAVVVTQAPLAARLGEHPARVVRVDADAATIATESADRPPLEVTPSHLAYVIFTSGSTGTPKGVAVEHRQIVNYVQAIQQRLALPTGASYAHVSTLSADLGHTVLFPSLAGGGCLHLVPQDVTTDPEALGSYFDREGIDCLKVVPSHLSALLGATQPARVLPRRWLVLGGEATSWELIDRVASLAPSCRVLNHYGPTETTVGVLTYPVDRGAPRPLVVPLGRPLPNCRVYALDPHREPAPIGVPGEVYIGGACVARGYLGRPDLTAERFVRDPFSRSPAARLYRTGDRARVLPSGDVVFLGRADDQVKVRGFRVELAEVEAAITASPAVREAAVIAEDGTLSAFLVPTDPSADLGALRAWLADRLPDAMIPSTFTALAALPLTANGKVDRRALAAIERRREEGADVAPRTPVEEVLAAIWADVFERDRVGIHERFADLGGHSLLAIQIIARARDAFQVDVPLRALFEAPTVASLAAAIDALRSAADPAPAPPIQPVPRARPLPLSFAQERLWFLDRLEPDRAQYNVASMIAFPGALDAAALARALAELVRRHEALRTTFALEGGQPVQIPGAAGQVPLPVVDLSDLPAADRDQALLRHAAAEARAPFDLAVSPLRARLVRLGPEDHLLLLTVHHVVSDARTQGILDREISGLYDAFRKGEASPFAEPALQYADYAVWQRRFLQGEVIDRQIAFWTDQLAGAPRALDLPGDRPRPPVMSYRGARHSASLPPSLLRSLADLSRRRGVTLFMTLLAAFDVLLHRWSGQDDLVVGTPMTGRTRPETEDIIGCFLNTLVIRARVSDADPFDDLLLAVREACLAAYAHQDLPFERLVQELAPERDLSRTPIFQVMFTLQSAGAGPALAGGVRRRSLPGVLETAKVDLTLFMVEGPSGLSATFEYATDLFDASTIERMAAQLGVLLAGIAAAPSASVADLPLLPEDERRRVLVEWNDTARPYPDGRSIVDLFEAAVDRSPTSPAVRFTGPDGAMRQISYRELDAWSQRLAGRLRSRGVGPDVPVGVSMDRSIELVVSVLAVLAAGGACVPLDPTYPRERLAVMLEDTRVPILLAQERDVSALPSHGARLLRIDAETLAQGGASLTTRVDRARLSSDHLAYVVFTSGSTGRPKGVAMPHRALVNLISWQMAASPGARRTLQLTSPSFDVFFQEIFATWCAGGVLSLITEEVRRDARRLRQTLADEAVERIFLPPVLLYQIAEATGAPPPPTLAEVITAGEQIQITPKVAELLADLPAVSLRNQYGPSETHVVTEQILAGDPRSWPARPAIGRPIHNARAYVLDARLDPVPIGVPGQLYLGGVGVARGYVGRPDLTADRFVPDPFGDPGGRLYRTGDLARHRHDGVIEFLGRSDHQVKVRGYRVELGEIEAAITAHPAVSEVVVVAHEQGLGDRRLAAYFTCRGEVTPSRDDLRALLATRLPDYMIPAHFVPLDRLPLTPSGKVDRRALPAPSSAEALGVPRGHVAPRDEVEIRLASIWREVLRVPTVGVTDGFFDLGGHSLLAVRMVTEAERVFGTKIPLVALFEAQTIEALARLIRKPEADRGRWPALVPIRTGGRRRPLFLAARPNVNALGYITLVRRLDPDQPVYGLQLQYPEESELGRPYTIDERRQWVSRYLELVRAVQPEGPYLLAGMCEGALIAFEMARRIEREGGQVALLGMFDTWPEENTSDRRLHALHVYERRIRDVMRSPPPDRVAFLRQRSRKALRDLGRLFRREPTPLARPGVNPWDERLFPGARFTPPQVHCRIDVFRCRTQPYWRVGDLELGWGSRSRGGVDVHVIDGDHWTFLRAEHVGRMARALRERIQEAEEEIELASRRRAASP